MIRALHKEKEQDEKLFVVFRLFFMRIAEYGATFSGCTVFYIPTVLRNDGLTSANFFK